MTVHFDATRSTTASAFLTVAQLVRLFGADSDAVFVAKLKQARREAEGDKDAN